MRKAPTAVMSSLMFRVCSDGTFAVRSLQNNISSIIKTLLCFHLSGKSPTSHRSVHFDQFITVKDVCTKARPGGSAPLGIRVGMAVLQWGAIIYNPTFSLVCRLIQSEGGSSSETNMRDLHPTADLRVPTSHQQKGVRLDPIWTCRSCRDPNLTSFSPNTPILSPVQRQERLSGGSIRRQEKETRLWSIRPSHDGRGKRDSAVPRRKAAPPNWICALMTTVSDQ